MAPVSWFVWLPPPDLELLRRPTPRAVYWILALREGMRGGLCYWGLLEDEMPAFWSLIRGCCSPLILDSFTVMLLLNPLFMLYIVEATEVLCALMMVILVLSLVLFRLFILPPAPLEYSENPSWLFSLC